MELFGIDELRKAVCALDKNRESWNQQFTAHQLLAICAAWRASEWDIYPDQWTPRQVKEALKGLPPQWRETKGVRGLTPVYTRKKKKA